MDFRLLRGVEMIRVAGDAQIVCAPQWLRLIDMSMSYGATRIVHQINHTRNDEL